MFDYHLDGIPQYIRIQFDGGFRDGVSGSGVQVLCATTLGYDMQPTWKTAWCASIFISNQNDSTSLDAELLGAERSIAAAVSLATTGIIRVDNTFNIILPVHLRHFGSKHLCFEPLNNCVLSLNHHTSPVVGGFMLDETEGVE